MFFRRFRESQKKTDEIVLEARGRPQSAKKLYVGFYFDLHPDFLKKTPAHMQVLQCW